MKEGEIAQHVERGMESPRRHPRLECGELVGRIGVERAAEAFQLPGEIARGPPARPLEDHVLQQMGHAAVRGLLVNTTLSHPEADGDGAHGIHALAEHDRASRETGSVHLPVEPPFRAGEQPQIPSRPARRRAGT